MLPHVSEQVYNNTSKSKIVFDCYGTDWIDSKENMVIQVPNLITNSIVLQLQEMRLNL